MNFYTRKFFDIIEENWMQETSKDYRDHLRINTDWNDDKMFEDKIKRINVSKLGSILDKLFDEAMEE